VVQSNQPGKQEADPDGDLQHAEQPSDQLLGQPRLKPRADIRTQQATHTNAMPVGQFGATELCVCADRIVKVTTPATDVTSVDASATEL
jgi:hypothetical protein